MIRLPAVGPLLGAAFDRAFVIFISRWRVLVIFAVTAMLAGFTNFWLGFLVLLCFIVYWFFASLANVVRIANPQYAMSAAEVARLVALGLIFGISLEVGFLFFVVPGIYLWVKWSLIQLITVKEGTGAADSLSRSWMLTENAFWPTLWFNVLASLAVGAVGFGGYLIAFGIIAFVPHLPAIGPNWSGGGFAGALLTAFFAIYLLAVAYTYQAKDLVLLYWYEALLKRQAGAGEPAPLHYKRGCGVNPRRYIR